MTSARRTRTHPSQRTLKTLRRSEHGITGAFHNCSVRPGGPGLLPFCHFNFVFPLPEQYRAVYGF